MTRGPPAIAKVNGRARRPATDQSHLASSRVSRSGDSCARRNCTLHRVEFHHPHYTRVRLAPHGIHSHQYRIAHESRREGEPPCAPMPAYAPLPLLAYLVEAASTLVL